MTPKSFPRNIEQIPPDVCGVPVNDDEEVAVIIVFQEYSESP